MVLSLAISPSAIARAIGYALGFKDLVAGGRYLPQRVAIVTPIATAKVSGFGTFGVRYPITSLKNFYDTFGMCPGFFAARILQPTAGGGLGTIPFDVFPIADADGATAAAGTITPSGTADANATHFVRFNGRAGIEGRQASFSVISGDTAAVISAKIETAINGMLYAPVTASRGVKATGNVVVNSTVQDGDTCVVGDGAGHTITFEYDDTGAGTGTLVSIVKNGAVVDEDGTRDNLLAAIAASALEITPVASATLGRVDLTNDNIGVAGNVAITQTGGGCSVTGMSGGAAGAAGIDLTARWKGATGNEITCTIDTGDDDCALAYAIVNPTGATGTHATNFAAALANIGDIWDTILVNCFGSETFDAIETFNGRPDVDTGGTGRWNAGTVKPLVAISGSVSATVATLKAFMAGRKLDLSNVMGTAPNSLGYTWEVAANWTYLAATTFNSTPHRTCSGKSLPDMPTPDDDDIGDMKTIASRDELVLAGCCTISYTPSAGYIVEDFITFRRPDSQDPLNVDFREVRSLLGIDFNVRYNYKLVVENNLIDKTLLPDTAVTSVTGTVKPKEVKSMSYDMADDLAMLAIIADPAYTKANTEVEISSTNAKRIEAIFPYKRTSCAGIVATTAYAAFYYGEG